MLDVDSDGGSDCREPGHLTESIRSWAAAAGFSAVGCCPAVTPTGLQPFLRWLDHGMAGSMRYLERRRDAYRHPASILDGARSLIALATDYRTEDPKSPRAGQGRISRYAWGPADYHDLIRAKLKVVKAQIQDVCPIANVRGVVDTAPLLERDFARLAGLGWQAKNTMLIRPGAGSWSFLSFLILDVELDYDDPFAADHCGTCRRCLDACPTDAFPEPYVLDARKCISYLTIELREAIPEELRSGIGDWVFGCDLCQEVCPWNRFSKPVQQEAFEPLEDGGCLDLPMLFEMDELQFRARFRKSPLWRSKRDGLLRNAAIVLGNQQAVDAIPQLQKALIHESHVVRQAVCWALAQMTHHPDAVSALQLGQQQERHPEVLAEYDRIEKRFLRQDLQD